MPNSERMRRNDCEARTHYVESDVPPRAENGSLAVSVREVKPYVHGVIEMVRRELRYYGQ